MILSRAQRRAIILGAGGHSRVIISILKMLGAHDILGVIDLSAPKEDEEILGVKVLGSIELLNSYRKLPDLDLYLALGDNELRHVWWVKCRDFQINMPNLIAPSAFVDPAAILGDGNLITPNAFIGPAVHIGNNNIFNTSCIVEHEVVIGDHSHIAPNSTICGRVVIGSRCFIGAAATIIDGVKLADCITVGAGSVVINDLLIPNRTYLGVPARCVD